MIAPQFSCPFCLDLLNDAVMTPCKHNFCRSCIIRIVGSGHTKCPLCRAHLHGFNPKQTPPNKGLAAEIDANVPQDVVAHRQSQAPHLLELVVEDLQEEMPQEPDKGGNAIKFTVWVALHSFANTKAATFIEKVVYDFGPTSEQQAVTAYPPFFSLRSTQSAGRTAFTVHCVIHWNALLGMPPMQVDHQLVFDKQGTQTSNLVELDPVAMQTLELDSVLCGPNSAAQQFALRQRQTPVIGMDSRAFGALALDVSQRQAGSNSKAKFPSSFMPLKPLPSDGQYFFEVVVGNHHGGLSEQAVGGLFHKWTMYVRLPDLQASIGRMIERVVYDLDPACSLDSYIRRYPKLELASSSKETSSVNCTIHWNPALGLQPAVVIHDLVFAKTGGRTSTRVGVSARRLKFFV